MLSEVQETLRLLTIDCALLPLANQVLLEAFDGLILVAHQVVQLRLRRLVAAARQVVGVIEQVEVWAGTDADRTRPYFLALADQFAASGLDDGSLHATLTREGERATAALESVQLAGYGARKPNEMSGGQRQRVALARVLVRRPKLLLLDEPFSALDAVTRADMQELLHGIVAQLGTGILIVTHDVEEAIELGDRILLMRRQPGTIEQRWAGIKGTSQQQRSALRAEIVESMSAILRPRSP